MLAILLSINSYYVYIKQHSIKQTIETNLALREFVIDKKNTVQSDLLESYKLLDTFLLDPSNKMVQEWMLSTLQHSIKNTDDIINSDWVRIRNKTKLFESLLTKLSLLKKEMINLTEIRADSERQYPSLKVATKEMRPNRIRFVNAINIALHETRFSGSIVDSELYQMLVDLRYSWSQLLSNFRIYLANQFGTFDLEILPQQEQTIRMQYDSLILQMLALKQRDKKDDIGFETSNAITDMSEALDKWYSAFENVKEIHHSDGWRYDLKILNLKIQPLLDQIMYLLILFDEEARLSEHQDKQLIEKIINDQSAFIYTVYIIIILILTLLLSALKILVFKPINQVTQAIKDEASGGEVQNLPRVNSSEASNLINSFTEMRAQIHLRQQELSFQANHDSLTGLPNRKYFLEKMDTFLHEGYSKVSKSAVMLIDLNGFKDINDTLGHHIGDQLLVKVGHRLWSILSDNAVIARLGGDEFAILVPEADRSVALKVLDDIQKIIEEKFIVDSVNTYIGMSVGIALYPDHGNDNNTLLRHADVAMYISKKMKTPYVFYKSSDDNYTLDRLSLIHDIKNSINHDGLVLYFQPKLTLNDFKLESVEALIRWNHPDFGIVMPKEFIPIAEQTGFINEITYWVIEESLIHALHWKESGQSINVSVNLSVYNLYDVDFINTVKTLLNKYHDAAEQLIFEITESAMMSNPKLAVSNLNKLQALGIRLSIDDYGTGFSSLSYLSQLSVNELKIDKSFILNMLDDERNSIIVKSTIEMAHHLGLTVVAEGVENSEVLGLLQSYGCDTIQGFLVSKPLPENDLVVWLDCYQDNLRGLIMHE
ncbi:MAG: EAL domain-containing protein [Gammaproteobacteria bacterium]|nr:EAL domain-containing protein [Gammaproteobacteria bacterium]